MGSQPDVVLSSPRNLHSYPLLLSARGDRPDMHDFYSPLVIRCDPPWRSLCVPLAVSMDLVEGLFGSAKLRVHWDTLCTCVLLVPAHVDDPQFASPAAPSPMQPRLLPPLHMICADITYHPSSRLPSPIPPIPVYLYPGPRCLLPLGNLFFLLSRPLDPFFSQSCRIASCSHTDQERFESSTPLLADPLRVPR